MSAILLINIWSSDGVTCVSTNSHVVDPTNNQIEEKRRNALRAVVAVIGGLQRDKFSNNVFCI